MKKAQVNEANIELKPAAPERESSRESIENNSERAIERESIELAGNVEKLKAELVESLKLQSLSIEEGLSIVDIDLAVQTEAAFRDIAAAHKDEKEHGVDRLGDLKDLGTQLLAASERMRLSGLEQEAALQNSDFSVVDMATLQDIDGSINSESRMILIGINEYENSDIQQLQGAVNDVKAVKRSLMERYGVSEQQIVVITNSSATKENILSSIDGVSRQLTDDQSLLVYYSGHGVKQGRKSEIVPHDYELPVEMSSGGRDIVASRKSETPKSKSEGSGIGSEELIAAIGGKNSIVITDMCWGGGLHRGLAANENLTSISATDDEKAIETARGSRDIGSKRKEIIVKNDQGEAVVRGFWSSVLTDTIDRFGRGIGMAAESAGSIAKNRFGQKTVFNVKGKSFKQGILD